MTNQHFLAAQQKGIEGNRFFDTQEYIKAIACYQEALKLYPLYSEIYFNLGLAYQALFQNETALIQFEQAIQHNPNYQEAHLQRGNILRDMQQTQLAKLSYETALQLDAHSTQALNNLGVIHYELRQIPKAIEYFERVINIDPKHINAHWGLSLCLLLLGEYELGWQEFEWRLKDQEFVRNTFPLEYEQYLWKKGDSIEGKTILVMAEQGLGDTLQFCRFARILHAMKARVILQVPQALVRLLQNLQGVDQVIGDHESAQNIDYVVPLMSLPSRLNLTEHHFSFEGSYLPSLPTKKIPLPIQDKSLRSVKVGLVWQGGHREALQNTWATHQRRNIPLNLLAQLAHPSVIFFSLQKGNLALQELHDLKKNRKDFVLQEIALDDFTDTANIIEQLDLVISVDTAVAHLAGAMAKPVWILNRFDGCWRWLMNRQQTPWYSSARLYFQQHSGDWQGVIDQVKQDLEVFISECK